AGSSDAQSFGNQSDTGGQRADTIILVRVDPRTRRAAMVSFPRDLWIPIAPDGHKQRINTAFENGPQQLINTISSNFNIPIHHYAQVDFKGFQGLVDAVGGVKIYLATPVRDKVTGLLILDTGCVQLHGDQSLAYVRSRHFQYQENGKWKSDPSGDIGRIIRQQDFIRRALREALSKGLTNPARLNRLVNVGLKNVKVSKSLDLKDVVNLGKNFRSLSPETLQQYQLPVTNTRINGAAVLKIYDKDKATAESIFQVFRGTPPAAAQDVQPSAVTARVLNGSGTAGQAGLATSALQQAQFSVASPGDAKRTSRTVIRYAAGQEAKAQLLERYLVSGAELQESASLGGVDVELVTGADFQGVLTTPRAPAPADATSTTLPASTPSPAAPEC
ncbi:MAG: transcriptional attenuator, LytR family, partial [Actinomycetia bacterium]|nr:transcriptional attenuator, LytR family [Actinomycetes bacterium]